MAGTTTIRITGRGKRELEKVRARMESMANRKVTQQEAAEKAFATAAQHPELLDADNWKPTKAQIEFMNSFIGCVSDGSVDSSKIDDELYGPREE